MFAKFPPWRHRVAPLEYTAMKGSDLQSSQADRDLNARLMRGANGRAFSLGGLIVMVLIAVALGIGISAMWLGLSPNARIGSFTVDQATSPIAVVFGACMTYLGCYLLFGRPKRV
jgi:hypothetical protein